MYGEENFESLKREYTERMQKLIDERKLLYKESGGESAAAVADGSDDDGFDKTNQNEADAENTTNAGGRQDENFGYTADAYGTICIEATSAGGAVPVEGAYAVISGTDENGAETLLYTLRTDSGGRTPTVKLAAYPASLSQNPDFSGKPYMSYTVTTGKDGYFTVINKGVPIFADRFSIQPVNMIALPENFDGDKTIVIPEREVLSEGESGGSDESDKNRSPGETVN